MSFSVQILLATYNGEAFLREQLDSLFAQSVQDFEVLVADDGSSDETVGLLQECARQHPGRVRVLFTKRVGGPARNFMRLVAVADAPYAMFCDQDDVWLPDKIERMVACARAAGEDSAVPVLVHSDLRVVTRDLTLLSPSLSQYQRLDAEATTVGRLILRNCVTGCASLLNRALVDILRTDDPDHMVMHDWWAVLVAAAAGRVVRMPEATVLYRQHAGNALGAVGARAKWIRSARRLVRVFGGAPLSRPFRKVVVQAVAFEQRYGPSLAPSDRATVTALADLARQGPIGARVSMLRHNLLNEGFTGNVINFLTY
jgi:glycosyltransferase involved in cell wall biosynthesis